MTMSTVDAAQKRRAIRAIRPTVSTPTRDQASTPSSNNNSSTAALKNDGSPKGDDGCSFGSPSGSLEQTVRDILKQVQEGCIPIENEFIVVDPDNETASRPQKDENGERYIFDDNEKRFIVKEGSNNIFSNLRCGACDSSTKKLMKCSRCYGISYCGRECQRSHWKEHKKKCDFIHRKKKACNLFKGPKYQSFDETGMMTSFDISRKLCKFKREGKTVDVQSLTSHGFVIPGKPLPEGIPANFRLKQQANLGFCTGIHNNSVFRNEAQFKNYYDDIVVHKDKWMEFFQHPVNQAHTEHTCGILGTLATIYRQRGCLEQCAQVLEMEGKVLEIFKGQIYSKNPTPADITGYTALRYKWDLIRFNLHFGLNHDKKCLPIYKELVIHEASNCKTYDDLFTLPVMLKYFDNEIPGPDILEVLPDSFYHDILKELKAAFVEVRDDDEEEGKQRTQLRHCGNCSKEETVMCEFNVCVRCRNVSYCCKDCQKADWKHHKKTCVKK